MVGFLKTVIFFTFVKLTLCDTCDPNHGTEGVYDCVRIPKYNGYQWAVCLSSQSLRKYTGRHMGCRGSAYCWLPCTQSVYPEIRKGHIAKECVCDPTENERRKRSLALEGREARVKVPPDCYIPAMDNNCQWYSKCLEAHSSCEGSDSNYAISYGKAICSIFLEEYNSFSEDGKSWIRSSQKCIEDRLRSVLMPNNTEDCRNIRDRAYRVHSDCYFQNRNAKFCNLLGTDQQKIYWSIKQVYEHAFREKFDEGMAKFRSCLRNDVYGHQRKFMFYVEKDSEEIIDENEFATSLVAQFDFSSHGIDWDVDKMTNSRKKREVNKLKGYQIVGIFVSRKQVNLVERSRRSANEPHLRKSLDTEYDADFLESLNISITNELKNNALTVLNIDKSLRAKRAIGWVAVTAGNVFSRCFNLSPVILCFPLWIGCIRSLLLIHSYRQGVLPDTPDDIDPRFYFYSVNKNDIQLRFSDVSSFSHFDPSKKTYIIVHGFLNNKEKSWISDMRRNILSEVDANVIVVDWEKGADHLGHYEQAAVNTEVVGTILALLVRSLEDHQGAKKSHIHIIGHSLGAHVAGFAGSAHKETRYQRITGIDPAGPFFNTKGSDARLDETDAHFVDVIHTDGGGLGYLNALGHLDFYPNGGQSQPGCLLTCSHSRAYELFTESILSNQTFKAWECDTLDQCKTGKGIDTDTSEDNRMGFYVDDTKKYKMYYLRTNKASPYDIAAHAVKAT
ncbi:uncharacterized protein LOC133173538 [Saccostrea echinata]|uniref:uncharacterized protein LOC133173538 n=1 Tax=Saccostrea echinata TaxID=191078 RepID=UPI002A832281|nr:uncharacterized protein LOC133173538 [Saccostrea echinata]